MQVTSAILYLLMTMCIALYLAETIRLELQIQREFNARVQLECEELEIPVSVLATRSNKTRGALHRFLSGLAGRGSDTKVLNSKASVDFEGENMDGDKLPEQLLSSLNVSSMTWQSVKEQQLYVYAAYHDPRLAALTVLAIVDVGKVRDTPITCVLWRKQEPQKPEYVPASIQPLPEDHEQRYTVAFLRCPSNHSADFVSLYMGSSKAVTSLTNILPVTTITAHTRPRHDFTVCLGPLHHEMNPIRFVEIVELNRMFGANHFIIHNSVENGSSVQPFFDYYAKLGVVSVLKWQLPDDVDNEVHYHGQMAVVNNCLYRSMYTSRYLVLTDLDEIIVPMKTSNWKQLLGTLTTDTEDAIGGYDFLSAFIKTADAPNAKFDHDAFVQKYDVLSLLKTTRKTSMLPHKRRSKMILRPERVMVAGIHYVHSYLNKDIRTLDVPSELGVMFHYKTRNPFRNSTEMQEERMHTFGKEIIHRLKKVYAHVHWDASS